MDDNKVFLNPGDIVTLKLDIPNKPTMMVMGKVTSLFKNDKDKKILIGIRCRWFTDSGTMQESIFNTKDLIKLN